MDRLIIYNLTDLCQALRDSIITIKQTSMILNKMHIYANFEGKTKDQVVELIEDFNQYHIKADFETPLFI